MNWQFGDDGPISALPESEKPLSSARKPASKGRRGAWLFIFLIALAASWTSGFYIGRVQRGTADLEAEIQGRLDVESWAWQQGDWDLFRSLLPPNTRSWRLKMLQTRFDAGAPDNRDMKLRHYVVSEDGNQIEVLARVSVGSRQYEIERTFYLIDGRWRLVRLQEFDGE